MQSPLNKSGFHSKDPESKDMSGLAAGGACAQEKAAQKMARNDTCFNSLMAKRNHMDGSIFQEAFSDLENVPNQRD